MESQEISKEIHEQFGIPIIEKSNYWLIRTESGQYYDDFYANNFVGIGWDYAGVRTIQNSTSDELKELIKSNEPSSNKKEKDKKREYTSIANKLIRFVEEIKAGDIVIIPSGSSEKISIGKIVDDEVYEDSRFANKFANESQYVCPFIKRRRVCWIMQQAKEDIDIYLFKLLSCHQAIYSANEYAEYISRTIYPVYISDGKLHATFRVGQFKGLSLNEFVDLADFINSITDGIDKKSTEVKLNIHCPGLIEISILVAVGGMTFACILFALNHFINGGKTKFSFKTKKGFEFNVDAESKGIIKRNLETQEFQLKKEIADKCLKLNKEIQFSTPKMDVDEKCNESDQGK